MMQTECAVSPRMLVRILTDGAHVDPLEASREAPVREPYARGIYLDHAAAVDARACTRTEA